MDLNILNKSQREAVTHRDGALLVLAGAGSGKTRVLTYRIAYLIEEHGVLPSSILALTFTNKAANEMRHRVERLIGGQAHSMWMGTFHSICVRILRADAERIGYSKDFVIYDTQDQKTLIKNVMKRLQISDKDLKINMVRAKISEAKNEMITPARYRDLNDKDYTLKQIGRIYEVYQDQLEINQAMDFDDLLGRTLDLFRVSPETLAYYQKKFIFTHVDEYQDTNAVQYTLIKKLTGYHHNLCVVGDNDQSIYGWRGADIRNIQEFEKDFPGARVVMLEQNYRSTQKILSLANSVIQKNSNRKDKNLWTDNASGDLIHYYEARDDNDEAYYVARSIIKSFEQGASYNDFAILYRTNAQSRIFEDAFNRASIPYKIIGGLKFYERKEVKDLIAYLKAVANPSDEISLMRVINVPKRGVGQKTIETLSETALTKGWSFFESIHETLAHKTMPPRALKGIKAFYDVIAPLHQQMHVMKGSEILDVLIKKTGYVLELQLEGTIEAQSRIENILELQSQILNFEKTKEDTDLNSFLQEISLLSDQDQIEENESGHVLMMTIHAAKGLEFPEVFLVGMEEKLFPSQMAMDTEQGVEEERRLCYVGITRAERHLHITHSKIRNRFGRTEANLVSRFISEMDQDLLVSHSGQIASREKPPISFSKYMNQSDQDVPQNRGQAAPNELRAGVRVKHKTFGLGMVISTKGTGDAMELTIAFDNKGIKKLAYAYAPLDMIK